MIDYAHLHVYRIIKFYPAWKRLVSVLEGESSASGSQHQSSSYQAQPQSSSYAPPTATPSSHKQHAPGPQFQLQPDQQLPWQQQPHPQQQQQQVTKLNTSAARSADSLAVSGRGQSSVTAAEELPQNDTVDSWEDIADSAETPQVGVVDSQVPAKKPAQQDLKTSRVINQTDSKSSLSSAVAASNKESGNQSSLTTGTAPSVSNGNGKKHPSPNLSEKKPGRSESKQAAAAALQQPPPKTEDDKENLNIVFIGHVGEWKKLCSSTVNLEICTLWNYKFCVEKFFCKPC